MQSTAGDSDSAVSTLPEIQLQADEPVTPEEIARRRVLYERAMRLREKIGPIDIPTDELKHLGRQEAEG